MINPWAILGAIVIALGIALASYYKGNENGQAKIQQKWDQEKAEMLAKHAEEVEKAREKEQNWQQAADNIRQEKDREIKNINARATALSNSLRERPDRNTASAGVMPDTSGLGQSGCTGKELFREDGEFLVRLAREADELRSALKQCYTQYESVRGR